jgi:hypothetical protein
MDRFKVSGQELCQHYTEATLLSQVFGDIEHELKQNKQVVCQFIVNGMALREEDEEKFSTLPLKDITTLEYLTEKTQTLVDGVIDGWINALPELIDKTEKLSLKIRNHGIHNHLKDVRDLVDNCQFLISSIISLKNILGDAVIAAVPRWEEAENSTQKTLRQAIASFEKKDFAELADVVDYDLNHGLQLWLEILESVEAIYTGKPVVTRPRSGTRSVDRKRISN